MSDNFIGKRLTMAEINKLFPNKFVVLTDVEVNTNNAICAGVLCEVVELENASKRRHDLRAKWPEYQIFPTFDKLPMELMKKYGTHLRF